MRTTLLLARTLGPSYAAAHVRRKLACRLSGHLPRRYPFAPERTVCRRCQAPL